MSVCIRRDLHSRLEGDGDSPFPAGLASGYETDLDLRGEKVVAVLSGGNIDAELLFRIVKARIGRGSDTDS